MQEALEATLPIIEILESLPVPYFLGGSLASSFHGVPRATLDADLVAALEPRHTDTFLNALMSLGDAYYADPDSIRKAIVAHGHFNLLHLDSMFKVDVFVCGTRPYDRIQLERRSRQILAEDSTREVFLPAPEDLILAKLEWYRAGGETSDRQWQDILGVLRRQGDRLDRAYLDRWAGVLGVASLLDRAFGASCPNP